MQDLVQDLRFALRVMGNNPVTSAVIVLTLALGIAGNTAMFSGFDAWILRPLAFRDPEQLVALHESQPRAGEHKQSLSTKNYLDWQRQSQSFSAIGAFARRAFNLQTEDEPERIQGTQVTASLFPLLGVEPILGRAFTLEEDQPGAALVALISHDTWQERLGGDPEVVGTTLRLDDQPHLIVGVMPPGFEFPEWAEVWTPLGLSSETSDRETRWLSSIARLAPGISREGAGRELGALAARLEREYPQANTGWTARVDPLRDEWVPSVIHVALLASLGAAGFVLLIICANVTNLMLAQAVGRRRETALRGALGASRWRLARQMLTESLLLALLAGGLGVLLGSWWIEWMKSSAPVEIPYLFRFGNDGRALGYAVGVSLVAGLVCGLAPMLRSLTLKAFDTLKSGGSGSGDAAGTSRFRNILVAAEFGACVLLLVGSLLMVKSFLRQQRIDPGYRTSDVLTLRLSMTSKAFETTGRGAFLSEALELIQGLPGVETAGAVSRLPESSNGWAMAKLDVEGRAFTAGEEPRTTYFSMSQEYLEALGVPVTEGRIFTTEEMGSGAAVALVSRSLAHRLWPEGEALNRRIRTAGAEPGAWLRVVGVVAEIEPGPSMVPETSRPEGQLYVPYGQDPTPFVTLAVHTGADPLSLAPAVRQQLQFVDSGVPISDVMTLEEARLEIRWVVRYFAKLLSLYAGLALAIAALGAYGVSADSVSRRQREIGIRKALGAQPQDLLRHIVRRGVFLAAAGVVAGLLVALPMTRLAASMLIQVDPNDPVVFLGVALLLALLAAAATYLPARRAARLDPMEILRFE